MAYSKYYFAVEAYPPIVKPGKRITVKGRVYLTKEYDLGYGRKSYGAGDVVTNQPHLLLDIMYNDVVSSEWKCIKTKKFVAGADGAFSFYVYTKNYKPSRINYLARFYAERENPSEFLLDQFVQVMGSKEYDEFMQALKPFGSALKAFENFLKRTERVFKNKAE